MYIVKILHNTVSENLELLIGFYIDEVLEKHPGAIIGFQYQALQGIREEIYSCMITVNYSIIDTHYPDNQQKWQKHIHSIRLKVDELYKDVYLFSRQKMDVGSAGMQPTSDIDGAG